jgi:hypothetical protein
MIGLIGGGRFVCELGIEVAEGSEKCFNGTGIDTTVKRNFRPFERSQGGT